MTSGIGIGSYYQKFFASFFQKRRFLLASVPLGLAVYVLLTISGAMAEPMGGGLPHFLLADVFGTALAFMAPRTLEPTPAADLTVWGLHGITAIDPTLTTVAAADRISLVGPQGAIVALPAPGPDDAAGWGDTAASLIEAAAAVSPPLRAAGVTAVIRSFFEELFNHLDPYSRYVSPNDAAGDRAQRGGSGGVGFTVGVAGGRIVVLDIAPASPAALAGVAIGDLVQAVDGHRTRGKTADMVDDWLAGDVGSTAEIVLRHPTGAAATIELERVLVPPITVTAKRDGDLAVITITGFSADTAARLDSVMTEMLNPAAGHRDPPQGLVIDLRDNRGGLLRQAIEAANLFIASGTIVSTQGRAPLSNHEFVATQGDIAHGLDLVVLVDGRSASAAEILAASIADNRRGVVVGSATLGKGLVQTILPLPDGGELFVTWSRVVAPRGWPIQGLGVLPQVCTSNGDEALDRQLAALAQGEQPMADALARSRAARAPVPSVQLLELRSPCPAAEANDRDLAAAHWLVDHQVAYQTALLPVTAR